MARYFHLDEARALLPRVEKVVRNAVSARSNREASEQAIQNLMQRIMVMGGITVDRLAVEHVKLLRESSEQKLNAAMEEMGDMGCVVKDLETGLIDFPTLFQGEEVYLCWRMDESDIQFWHGVHEGFDGRKEIDRFFVANHKGSEYEGRDPN